MGEEEGKGKEGEKGKEEGKGKEGEKESFAQVKQKLDAAEAKLKESEKKVQIFDNINSRFKTDDKFRTVFNATWKGEDDVVKKMYGMTDAAAVKPQKEEEEPDEIVKLSEENKKLHEKLSKTEEKIDKLSNVMGYKEVQEERGKINVAYKNTFDGIAEKSGYTPGSREHGVLYKLVVEASKAIAEKYQLIDENGFADPLLKFTPELIKEATEMGIAEMKDIGYDVQERKRQELVSEKKNLQKKETDEESQFFDPEKLKTSSGRAKALKDAFYNRMRNKHGVEPEDLKIV